MAAHPRRGPVEPPIAPMLGKLVRSLPRGDFVYEPKWDGFRCLAFRASDPIELRSRNDRPLGRYFPELVAAVADVDADAFVRDGEILARVGDRYDFPTLMSTRLARPHSEARRATPQDEPAPAWPRPVGWRFQCANV